jgi:diguanylate cyclase (GGDEF)-like protein
MSFRFKTILGVALIASVLLFLLVFYSLQLLKSSNVAEFNARAHTTAALLAATTRTVILGHDAAALDQALRTAVTHSGALYARVRDPAGRLLAEATSPKARQAPRRAWLFEPYREEEGVLHASAEIAEAGVRVGRVELGFGKDGLEAVMQEAGRKTIALAVLEIMLVALFAYMLGIYLTHALDALKVGTQRVAGGEPGYEVEVRGKDELAETARAFNQMSNMLKQAFRERMRAEAELIALNQELERRVEQRTEELERAYRKIERQALYDPLTSLPNRTLFQAHLLETIEEARRSGRGFALAILDFNGFKEINDTLGHHAGDLALQEIATRLRSAVDPAATVARLGGDEFALLLPGAGDLVSAASAFERVPAVFEQPVRIGARTVSVGASIGVARYPEDGTDPSLLMRRADAAMYNAKRRRLDYVLYSHASDQGRLAQH